MGASIQIAKIVKQTGVGFVACQSIIQITNPKSFSYLAVFTTIMPRKRIISTILRQKPQLAQFSCLF
eukprot:403349114